MYRGINSLLYLSCLLLPAFSAPSVDSALELGWDRLQSHAQTVLSGAGADAWAAEDGREFVKQEGVTYLRTTHPSFADSYQLRTQPNASSLCDSTVKQQSGYLDINHKDHHLFYWFFESRNSPETAPLILWLNGGPGCSSSTGLLFELGPCRVTDGGASTVPNPHSWNEYANIIFLDQPIGVGYSYSSDGSTISDTPVAAQDVWAFLELFMKQFPQYSKLPFHLAAESYGGIYGPNIAFVINKKNEELSLAPVPDLVHINLVSVVLANGLTDPYTQFGAIPEYACNGPYALYDDPQGPECTSLFSKASTCQTLVKACYNFNSKWVCVPAQLYCNSQMFTPIQTLGLNPYDVRRTCDPQKDGQLCYKEMSWIDVYLNKPEVKKALGAPEDLTFQSCNMEVNLAFTLQGDSVHNAAELLVPLLNKGVRLLVYAGKADFMCNFIGNEAWVHNLDGHPFAEAFKKTQTSKWVTLSSGTEAGDVRSVGTNYTFVAVNEAGHMVPFDQPEAAADLIARWINSIPLTWANSTVV
ncbi:carboxypeptidase C [Hysterangium stoloniferum]|nr:carboxypeptidase C [Hysterangium stoloniferum]